MYSIYMQNFLTTQQHALFAPTLSYFRNFYFFVVVRFTICIKIRESFFRVCKLSRKKKLSATHTVKGDIWIFFSELIFHTFHYKLIYEWLSLTPLSLTTQQNREKRELHDSISCEILRKSMAFLLVRSNKLRAFSGDSHRATPKMQLKFDDPFRRIILPTTNAIIFASKIKIAVSWSRICVRISCSAYLRLKSQSSVKYTHGNAVLYMYLPK